MIGPEGAAAELAARITTRLPGRLTILEERLGLDPGTIPTPAKVLAHEDGPLGVEDWPAVYVLPQRLDRLRLLDVGDNGVEHYRAGYAVRVLVWCRAEDYADTDQLRKRYALAVRETLLELKAIGADPDATDATVVDPSSIREDYSDVLVDAAKRTIAGAWLDVTLVVTETLETQPPAPTVTGVDVTPTHPALA